MSGASYEVLVVTTWFPDATAASRTPFIVEHVRAAVEQGHRVRVLHVLLGGRDAGSSTATLDLAVSRVVLNPRRPWTVLRAWRHVREALRDTDVLHTMAFSSALVCALPWLSRRRPWVHTEHWNGVSEPGSVGTWWMRLRWTRHVLRLPHLVTGVTPALADRMSDFTRRDATRVVPCVVEPPGAPAPWPGQPPLRLVGVGLLNDRKDPLLAVETIHRLRKSGMDVHYTWVGDGPLRAAVEARVIQLGLSGHVSLVGAVDPSEVWRHLSAAHLFFLPSHQENFFTAVAEAIAVGRPAVVPASGGFVAYCTPDNSVLVDSWDVPALAAAISRGAALLDRTSALEVAATLGRSFDRSEVGRTFSTLYDEVVAR
ncbi:glycosyltransferase family 4 protein [Nocardioides dilutus]